MWVSIVINMQDLINYDDDLGIVQAQYLQKIHKDGKEANFLHKSQLIESNGYKGDIISTTLSISPYDSFKYRFLNIDEIVH